MERKALIAIVLSILVMVVWFRVMERFYPPQEVAWQEELSREEEPISIPQAPPAAPQPISGEEKETILETERFRIVLTNRGGCIKGIELKRYDDKLLEESLKLFEIQDPRLGIFFLSGLGPQANIEEAIYQMRRQGESLIYNYELPHRLEIEKRFAPVFDKFAIELQVTIRNLSNRSEEFGYRVVAGSRTDSGPVIDRRYIEVASSVNGRTFRRNIARLKDKEATHPGGVSWVALKNRYFSLILTPFVATSYSFFRRADQEGLSCGLGIAPFSLPPKSSLTHKFLLYAGPNDYQELQSLQLGLEETLSLGMLGGISRFLLKILRFFYVVVHNYGLSIILLSALISFVLYPLTLKSVRSMKEMQALQPHIEDLRSKYKDNQQKLNREMMELYKKHKVNPLGGCLPMLLQMPIFIALYQALTRSIELWRANFLWIKDLSRPDRAFRLQFSLPLLGDSINILPILMIGAMFVQQKISTPKMAGTGQQQQQQKMMTTFMPIMFGFIFYNFPSGLVLYWLTNTILMAVQHSWIAKSQMKPRLTE